MKKDNRVYIEDMLDAIEKIETYVFSLDEIQFSRDQKIQDAVIFRFAVIGEAAGKISEEVKQKSKDIPWRQIIGLRNMVIHEYSGISLGRVWAVIREDLPTLKANLIQLSITSVTLY